MKDEQLLRYGRHIMLDGLDYEGQQRLLDASVLIVGLGGLGSPVSMYLAASGVGELHLADFDRVDLSNLQRQIVHDQARVGQSKVASAAARLAEINPEVRLVPVEEKLAGDRLAEAVERVDLVVDCSDNFDLRFALNAACAERRVPLVSGAAIQWAGQVTVFDHRDPDTPCYRCLYREEGENELRCAETGVLSPLVGMIGSLQAAEAIKVLAGTGRPLVGRLALFDLRDAEWRTVKYRQDPACPICEARRAR
ncbi:molybdopterin-synthase adenylyltransferase MoeB [Guyparkeria sp. SCN-R1]|uniref:HesA/MoeB/ThiF family protein n=1 Tax=Guyparkeria sp. SCN-R1 TaxID=2341113 RepID=UPI000F64911D|nr:molybdopterin-synthase adenylyltransferase MoeB [Guyparkeria sp. SCN-R1]RRQ20433.1 molybdopterin-synthase adenylyltransferase MoeB [Guyparkeria sp. SCN-R1]